MVKKADQKNSHETKVLEEIRDLLILIAAKSGATNNEVAKLLKCGESTLRKKVSFKGEKNAKKK
jgi:hypothetical protein